jgi:hypothetical protein
MEDKDQKEELVLPELDDKSMELLNERARTIYARLKADGTINGSNDDILDSAIVLGIFAVFNPKNIPMTEEQIQTVFDAYTNWIRRRVFN